MPRPPAPRELKLDEAARLLRIGWTDGHASAYPLRYLRGFCPCADCQGHAPGPKVFIPTEKPRLTDVRLVGRYALTPVWDDGHVTGIYSFEYLRELCPCPACRPGGIAPEHR